MGRLRSQGRKGEVMSSMLLVWIAGVVIIIAVGLIYLLLTNDSDSKLQKTIMRVLLAIAVAILYYPSLFVEIPERWFSVGQTVAKVWLIFIIVRGGHKMLKNLLAALAGVWVLKFWENRKKG